MARLDFNAATHTYTLDGVVLPSVTQITRFVNYDIADGARAWLRDAAADRGRRVHEICADIDLGAEPEAVDWDCAGYVAAYKAFLRDYRIREWEAVELPIGSEKLGYAGTIDRVGIIDGTETIVDLKTGSKIRKPALAAQLTGYAALWRERTMNYNIALWGLQLKKDGKYSVIPCDYDDALFSACLTLHERTAK